MLHKRKKRGWKIEHVTSDFLGFSFHLSEIIKLADFKEMMLYI